MDREIENAVKVLAVYVLDTGVDERFHQLVQEKAANLKAANIVSLKSLLRNPPRKPETRRLLNSDIGDWLNCCQFAIFELIYNIGETALPALSKLAWEEYDWNQAHAIEVMLRLAADGVQTEAIIHELKENYHNLRYEARLEAVKPLMPMYHQGHERLRYIFNELMCMEDFEEVYIDLTHSCSW